MKGMKVADLGFDYETTVVSPEFAKHGYSAEAGLLIQPNRGRYVVELGLNASGGIVEREVAYEPAEPEKQVQGCQWAFENPVEAVLDAIKIDKGRREEAARD
jgi:hypothetical protein